MIITEIRDAQVRVFDAQPGVPFTVIADIIDATL